MDPIRSSCNRFKVNEIPQQSRRSINGGNPRKAISSQVIASRMEAEGLQRCGKTVLGQIPQPDRPAHDEIDEPGSA